jgi:ATP/maltotriose-dependent transcriptional regulator MalT
MDEAIVPTKYTLLHYAESSMGAESEDRAQSDTLLQTILFMPAPRDDLIQRPRLVDLLQSDLLQQNDVFNRNLTLITAPAGYGKTPIACQWLTSQPDPGRPVNPRAL